MPTLKYSCSILANEPTPYLGTAQGPDPVSDARCRLLPRARTHARTRARLSSGSGELLGRRRRWVQAAGGPTGLPHSRSPSSHDPWPCRLLVLASPPLRGINGVFPGIRGVLHRGTPMSWRRDPSVHCFKRLGRILWMAKR